MLYEEARHKRIFTESSHIQKIKSSKSNLCTRSEEKREGEVIGKRQGGCWSWVSIGFMGIFTM